MKRENSAGVLLAGTSPNRVKVSRASLVASALRSAALSAPTTSGEVPAGATRPLQKLTWNAGRPASATVGTSGSAGSRAIPVIASARRRPARICGSKVTSPSKINCTSPALTACSAGAPPLYGTCTRSTPARLLNISAARCGGVALPADP